MIDKVLNNIVENRMFKDGDKIIVAVSGGPDSMCLLHLLHSIKERYGISIVVAHVNHCMRPGAADEDEEYVKAYCLHEEIEFYSRKINVNDIAKKRGISSETAARDVRYEYFQELKIQLGANKIALAHNYNDQAETILMRIMRGTGIEGLKGIQPVRDNVFIRPILVLKREEVEQYCINNYLKPRIDATNNENIYSRNKIRLELIPYIQQNFNKDIISTLNRFSYIMTKDNEFLEEITNLRYPIYCNKDNNTVVIDNLLLGEHDSIITRIIRKAISSLVGTLNNIEMKHIYDIIQMFNLGTGRRINLPNSIIVENIYGSIHIYKNLPIDNKDISPPGFSIDISTITEQKMEYKINEGTIIKLEIINSMDFVQTENHKFINAFDYDLIGRRIEYRFRMDGDTFAPLGMSGNKKLKNFFIDLKIPKNDRNKIPLICFDDEIAWVVGLRTSKKFVVTENTKRILIIKVLRGEN